jgi:hypothetical protein
MNDRWGRWAVPTTAVLALAVPLAFATACSDDKAADSSAGGDAGSDQSSGGDGASADGGGGGDGASGDDAGTYACSEYCTKVLASCTGDHAQYFDNDSCMAQCALLPGSAATTGNTIGCRAYHADNAKTMGPTQHCKHAGPTGGGVCGTRCESFCDRAVGRCSASAGVPAADVPFQSKAACLSACNAFTFSTDAGEFVDNPRLPLNCRQYHLKAVFEDGPGHCPHVASASNACD